MIAITFKNNLIDKGYENELVLKNPSKIDRFYASSTQINFD